MIAVDFRPNTVQIARAASPRVLRRLRIDSARGPQRAGSGSLTLAVRKLSAHPTRNDADAKLNAIGTSAQVRLLAGDGSAASSQDVLLDLAGRGLRQLFDE